MYVCGGCSLSRSAPQKPNIHELSPDRGTQLTVSYYSTSKQEGKEKKKKGLSYIRLSPSSEMSIFFEELADITSLHSK
jgi:hypothetical protein